MIVFPHGIKFLHLKAPLSLETKSNSAGIFSPSFFQFPPRRDRKEQTGQAERRGGNNIWHAIHHYIGMHDGPPLLSPRLPKLHS